MYDGAFFVRFLYFDRGVVRYVPPKAQTETLQCLMVKRLLVSAVLVGALYASFFTSPHGRPWPVTTGGTRKPLVCHSSSYRAVTLVPCQAARDATMQHLLFFPGARALFVSRFKHNIAARVGVNGVRSVEPSAFFLFLFSFCLSKPRLEARGC